MTKCKKKLVIPTYLQRGSGRLTVKRIQCGKYFTSYTRATWGVEKLFGLALWISSVNRSFRVL